MRVACRGHSRHHFPSKRWQTCAHHARRTARVLESAQQTRTRTLSLSHSLYLALFKAIIDMWHVVHMLFVARLLYAIHGACPSFVAFRERRRRSSLFALRLYATSLVPAVRVVVSPLQAFGRVGRSTTQTYPLRSVLARRSRFRVQISHTILNLLLCSRKPHTASTITLCICVFVFVASVCFLRVTTAPPFPPSPSPPVYTRTITTPTQTESKYIHTKTPRKDHHHNTSRENPCACRPYHTRTVCGFFSFKSALVVASRTAAPRSGVLVYSLVVHIFIRRETTRYIWCI